MIIVTKFARCIANENTEVQVAIFENKEQAKDVIKKEVEKLNSDKCTIFVHNDEELHYADYDNFDEVIITISNAKENEFVKCLERRK